MGQMGQMLGCCRPETLDKLRGSNGDLSTDDHPACPVPLHVAPRSSPERFYRLRSGADYAMDRVSAVRDSDAPHDRLGHRGDLHLGVAGTILSAASRIRVHGCCGLLQRPTGGAPCAAVSPSLLI